MKLLMLHCIVMIFGMSAVAGNTFKKQRFYNTPQQPSKVSPKEAKPDTPQYAQAHSEQEVVYCNAETCTNTRHAHFDFLRFAGQQVALRSGSK